MSGIQGNLFGPDDGLTRDGLADEALGLPPQGTVVLYRDEEMRLLDSAYEIASYRGPVPSTLGQYEFEKAAAILLGFSRREGALVGVSSDELASIYAAQHCEGHYSWLLKTYTDALSLFCSNRLVRQEQSGGIAVVYPTEKLLENQKVPKKA